MTIDRPLFHETAAGGAAFSTVPAGTAGGSPRPVALITGGSSGIGAAFARILADRGYDLVLVARRRPALAELAEHLRRSGTRVEVIAADLADRRDVDRVADRLADPQRPVQMLVNSAGFGPRTAIAGADPTEHERVIAVMMLAVLVLSGAAARAMQTRGSGTIVNVSSVAGGLATGAYSAAKVWTTNITESLAVEMRGTGVRVVALQPGWVRTQFHRSAGIPTGAIPGFLWLDPDDVVAHSLRDAARGRVISTPSARFKILSWLLRHQPRSITRRVSGFLAQSRRRP